MNKNIMTINQINHLIQLEHQRQNEEISLIASENYAPKIILEAQGSILTNKYAEGYPGGRYYSGCSIVNDIEQIAIDSAKSLFQVSYVNVQPHSGSQANQAAFSALMKYGDTFLSLSLSQGGHLTHGHIANFSSKLYQPIHYSLKKCPIYGYDIDYDDMEKLAIQYKPKMILAGYTMFCTTIDWHKIRQIADKVGAYLLADISHISGLVATSLYPSPVNYADLISTTTHKTLRGPRGAILMTNDLKISKKMNTAVFPYLQGGPFMNTIAAKGIAFELAKELNFRQYTEQIIKNSRAMLNNFLLNHIKMVYLKTDNHMLVIDLSDRNISGKELEESLELSGIQTNRNQIPFDPQPPTITSGLRLGTAAITTIGFQEKETIILSDLIIRIINNITNKEIIKDTSNEVKKLRRQFPQFIS